MDLIWNNTRSFKMKCQNRNNKLIKDENICKIIDDLGNNIKGKEVLYIALISVFCTLLPFFCGYLCMDEISDLLCSIQPNLLGFSIAAYTILFGFDEALCRRLKNKAHDNKIPFEVLHASFTFGIVFQGFSLIVGLLSNVLLKCMNEKLAISICWFLLFFSIIWTINMILYFYAARTFIVESQEDDNYTENMS